MRDVGLGEKVYSPDLQTFELDGPTGVFGVVAALLVGPLRLITRVVHNVMILPADLLASYASGLFVVGAIMTVIGAIDLVFYRRWPMLVSQIVVLGLAIMLKSKARVASEKADVKAEIEIDDKKVEDLCNSLVPQLDAIIKESAEND